MRKYQKIRTKTPETRIKCEYGGILDEDIMKNAWSIESREAHESHGDLEYVGERQQGIYIYKFYRDPEGKTFYETRVCLESGKEVSHYEYIFGTPAPVEHRIARKH